MNKKRYAGLLWTQPEKYDKIDTKVWTEGVWSRSDTLSVGRSDGHTSVSLHRHSYHPPQGIETVRRDNCVLVSQSRPPRVHTPHSLA